MASSVENEDIPQHLTCPVCFELPEAEVFQCRDGHMLCKCCYCKVEDCPQCRIAFDKQQPIRNRHIEEVLKGYWTDCPFKSNGCTEEFLKTYLKEHRNECRYNFERFGELVSICKEIGYPTCDFKFNKQRGKEAVEHLVSKHKVAKTNTNFKMELKSFKESAKGGSTGFTIWKPIITELKEGFLVTAAVLNRKDGSFSTWTVFLEDLKKETRRKNDAVQVKYSVEHADSLDIWKGEAIYFDGNYLFDKIKFNLNSISFLPHCGANGSLEINVKILKHPGCDQIVKISCPKMIFLTLNESL